MLSALLKMQKVQVHSSSSRNIAADLVPGQGLADVLHGSPSIFTELQGSPRLREARGRPQLPEALNPASSCPLTGALQLTGFLLLAVYGLRVCTTPCSHFLPKLEEVAGG